jgi:hypothetical protein
MESFRSYYKLLGKICKWYRYKGLRIYNDIGNISKEKKEAYLK